MKLKNRILEILENSGLTPSEFAEKIDVQRSAISHITSGRNKPSLDFLIKIKKSFPEIDTDWLIFGEEKQETNPPLTSEKETSPLLDLNLFSEQKNEIPSLFNDVPSEVGKVEKQQPSINKKKIKRIVFIYDDNSFEDFTQS